MEVLPYKIKDESSILELFKLSFGREMSLDYWNWRFKDNPFIRNDEDVIFLMWDNDLLVGHYAISPCDMMLNGKNIRTALSMTTMTHPAYGGRGIFTQLANEVYRHIENDLGYSMVWGFPNNNSHYGFINKLDWKDISIVPSFFLPTVNFDKLHGSTNVTFSEYIQLAEDEFVDSSIYIKRTQNYLDWRYRNNPINTYYMATDSNTGNQFVYKVYDLDGEFQVDLFDVNIIDVHPSAILSLLCSICDNENHQITQFNIWINHYNDKFRSMEKAGFRLNQDTTFLGYKPMNNIADSVSEIKNWNINYGYSDLF